MRPRVLVTGGAGFIGSHLIESLLEYYDVIAIDNFDGFYSRTQKELNIRSFINNKGFTLIEGDIRNLADLQIPEVNIVVHLAAKAGVRPSFSSPLLFQDVNVSGTLALLEFARSRSIKQFIFASSSSVYGINENMPWDEEGTPYPISPYASTKLSCESWGQLFSELYGIRFLALRLFTVYGPRQRPDLAIHKFYKAISNNESITVYGNGESSRDYTYVQDIVDGIIAAIKYEPADFEVINLGSSNPITLNELIVIIENLCGKKARIKRMPEQRGDVRKTFASISKARRLLGYEPHVALETGLELFKRWYTTDWRHNI